MDLDERLGTLKERALKNIEVAARGGDTSIILSNTRILEQVEQLTRRLHSIKSAVDGIEKPAGTPETEAERTKGDIETGNGLFEVGRTRKAVSSRLIGQQRKQDFRKVIKEQGIQLIQKSGSIFTMKGGGLGKLREARKSGKDQMPRWVIEEMKNAGADSKQEVP